MQAHRGSRRESGQVGGEPAVSVLLRLPAIRHRREHDELHDLTGDVLLITWELPLLPRNLSGFDAAPDNLRRVTGSFDS